MSLAILGAVLGVLTAGLLSSARTAFFSADHEDLQSRQREGRGWAHKAVVLMEQPDRIYDTTRLGAELALLGSAISLLAFSQDAWWWGWAVASMALYLLLFVLLGELVPQAIVAKTPSLWIPVMTRVIHLAYKVGFPWILMQRAGMVLGSGEAGRERGVEPHIVSRQELSWLIRGQGKGGELLEEERRMIHRIFRFSEAQVREVMIPLIDVVAVEEGATVLDVIHQVEKEGYSRFPVYRERIDNILGVVRSFDLLEAPLDEGVLSFLRKVPFVPESMPVDELMLQLQREGDHMAVVVDEYGGGVGIVTMEDLLEEIVGEIEDEYDIQESHFRRLSTHQFLFNGRVDIEEVNELTGLLIPKEDYETLGGFLLKAFRRVPKEGESLIYRDAQFTIQKADERSIQEVLIQLPRGDGHDKAKGGT